MSRRKLSSAATASISVSFPRGASRSSQARNRTTAAPSRTCAARAPAISVAFFTAFIRAIGSGPRATLPPAWVTILASASAAVAWSSRTLLLCGPERREVLRERRGLAHVGKLLERVAHGVGELAAVDIERRTAVLRHDREGERQGRVRDVGAADVEGPRHRPAGWTRRARRRLSLAISARMRSSLAAASSPA